MENKNFLNIQGWMVKELKLSGNELLCYALIYGFSQDGQSVFSGSSKYIQEWLNISMPTIFATLKKLCERGLIEKIEKVVNGCRLCDYKIILDPLKKFNGGTKETLVGGTKETLVHNNIVDNTNDNKKINKKEYSEDFELFWSLYPKQRRGNKDKANNAYCRVLKENRCTKEKLLESVKKYSVSKTVKDGYAKGCEAWLNDDRFNWHYEEPASKAPIGMFGKPIEGYHEW